MLSIISLSSELLSEPLVAKYYLDAPEPLAKRLVLGELNQDPTLVASAVERWLAISPNDPAALYAQWRWLVRQQQSAKAQRVKAKLLKIADPQLQQSMTAFSQVTPPQSNTYSQALLFEKGGDFRQALTLLDEIYGTFRPDIITELAYLEIKSRLSEAAGETLSLYRYWDKKFPGVAVIRVGLARHLARYNDPQAAIAIYREVIRDKKVGNLAAKLWLYELKKQTMSEQWLASYRFIAQVHSDDLNIKQQFETAKTAWEQEAKLRADADYINKLTALANTEQQIYLAQDFKALLIADSKWPQQPQILVALARHNYHNQNYPQAIKNFKKAQELDNDPDMTNFYKSMIISVSYWQQYAKAEQAIATNDYQAAMRSINKAIKLDDTIAAGYALKAQIEGLRKNYTQANILAKKALQRDPLSASAIRSWLTSEYRDPNFKGQLQGISKLSPQQQALISEDIKEIEHRLVYQQLELMSVSAGDEVDGLPRLKKVISSNLNNPWLRKDIAEQLVRLKQTKLADFMLKQSLKRYQDGDHAHSYLLYLAKLQRWNEISIALEQYQHLFTTVAQSSSYTRIKRDYYRQDIKRRGLNDAQIKMYIADIAPRDLGLAIILWADNGAIEQARTHLAQLNYATLSATQLQYLSETAYQVNDAESHKKIAKTLQSKQRSTDVVGLREGVFAGDKAVQNEQFSLAIKRYLKAYSEGLQLGSNRMNFLLGNASEQLLSSSLENIDTLSNESLIANLEIALKTNNQTYIQVFNERLRTRELTAYDYWRLKEAALEQSSLKMARSYATQGLQLEDQQRLGLPQPRDINSVYRDQSGQWLSNDLIRTIEQLDQPLRSHFMVGIQYDQYPNGSQYLTLPMELDVAMQSLQGRLKLRTESVYLESRPLTYYDTSIEFQRHRVGQNLSVAWQSRQWQIDIGTTPFGFRFHNWVGGLEGQTEIGNLLLRANISRRAITSSYTSYSGINVNDIVQQVPEFGGVLKTGGAVSASWNDGRPFGFWSNIQYHKLSGTNVYDNNRKAAMAGAYYNFINDGQHALSVGSSLFYMGYDRNLNRLVVGHGDYYSPRSYVSVAVPISYYRRHNYDWTYGIRATPSYASASFDAPYLLDQAQPDNSQGFNARLQLFSEYKISNHWSVVGYFSRQFLSDYQPSLFNLQFRYHFQPYRLNASLQPEPLEVYADYP